MRYICDSSRHLVCIPYSIENLHQMAEELKINRCWFHASPITKSFAHYDIPKRRIKEITEKCELVSSKVIIQICKGDQDAL